MKGEYGVNRSVRHCLFFGVGLLTGLVLPFTAWSADQLRTFTDIQSRSFEGRIMAFNQGDQLVTILRVDGKAGKIGLDQLSDNDRQYISNWGITNNFMNCVEIATKLASDGVQEDDRGASEQVADFHYLINLTNSSASVFGKITMEYCIFYRQGERDGNTVTYDEGTYYGKAMVDSLAANSSVLLKTKDIKLYSKSGLNTLFGVSDNLADADIRGIWLRFKTKSPLGDEMVREYRTSDDERWKWTAYSIAAGRNPGTRGAFKYSW